MFESLQTQSAFSSAGPSGKALSYDPNLGEHVPCAGQHVAAAWRLSCAHTRSTPCPGRPGKSQYRSIVFANRTSAVVNFLGVVSAVAPLLRLGVDVQPSWRLRFQGGPNTQELLRKELCSGQSFCGPGASSIGKAKCFAPPRQVAVESRHLPPLPRQLLLSLGGPTSSARLQDEPVFPALLYWRSTTTQRDSVLASREPFMHITVAEFTELSAGQSRF